MRKIMIAGLGGLSALTIAVGSATFAQAAPATVSQEICAAVPPGIQSVQDLEADKAAEIVVLQGAYTRANTDLRTKASSLVDALVEHVEAVDAKGDVAATTAIVTARVNAYASSAATWTQAWDSVDAARFQAEVLDLQESVLTDLGDGLVCTAPVTTTTTVPVTTTTTTVPVTTTTTVPVTTTTTTTIGPDLTIPI